VYAVSEGSPLPPTVTQFESCVATKNSEDQ
jgi:hypothetical protein